jgi:hypothetical protein
VKSAEEATPTQFVWGKFVTATQANPALVEIKIAPVLLTVVWTAINLVPSADDANIKQFPVGALVCFQL